MPDKTQTNQIKWHPGSDYVVLFTVSLLCVCLELFFTRILNLKTWNHVVYVIIPFATLGYGIGALFFLLFRKRIEAQSQQDVVSTSLILLAAAAVWVPLCLIDLPVRLEYLMNIFVSLQSGMALSAAYALLMIPFLTIGFIVVYLFSISRQESHKLYFWDLLGAGSGALAFFFLIRKFGVMHSLALLAIFACGLAVILARHGKRWPGLLLLLVFGVILRMPEPTYYNVDPAKNWEWIPGYFDEEQYETSLSRWHPLGRTDVYRFKYEPTRRRISLYQPGTFQINVLPTPEFSYFCTNFIAGSPIYKLSMEGLKEYHSEIKLFTQAMEFPYLFLNEPKVVVIGTGGGRDIFMAKSHRARKIMGAEINPVIYSEMSPGGKFYEYSGKVYGLDGVTVVNQDGRHLVKKLPSGSFDLIVLNGVDTFWGLSSGAYAYVESYLYTKEAVMDYLRICDKDGMINFNRWFELNQPRETLRLFVIVLDALRSFGIKKPWDHVMIGHHAGWGMMLVKRTPFSDRERAVLTGYFQSHQTELVFPSITWEKQSRDRLNLFDLYAKTFREGNAAAFIREYPFDISVVQDDNPFFYKYYKLRDFHPKRLSSVGASGTVIFLTQMVVLMEAVIFIGLFILLPLVVFKREGFQSILKKSPFSFVLFFSCLGVGFMFIEIPMMQKFALLLGSPIYSISVSLAALLIFSGLGSYLLTFSRKAPHSRETLLMTVSLIVLVWLILLVSFGSRWLDNSIRFSSMWRGVIVCLTLLPLGLCLGMFFPSGLEVAGRTSKEAVAWAWGINCGFTVLGSMLAIILAQFLGFSSILLLAGVAYLVAALAFRRIN